MEELIKVYEQVSKRIGDPLAPQTLCGPLHTRRAVEQFQKGMFDNLLFMAIY